MDLFQYLSEKHVKNEKKAYKQYNNEPRVDYS
jgi:hypothetical protein